MWFTAGLVIGLSIGVAICVGVAIYYYVTTDDLREPAPTQCEERSEP